MCISFHFWEIEKDKAHDNQTRLMDNQGPDSSTQSAISIRSRLLRKPLCSPRAVFVVPPETWLIPFLCPIWRALGYTTPGEGFLPLLSAFTVSNGHQVHDALNYNVTVCQVGRTMGPQRHLHSNLQNWDCIMLHGQGELQLQMELGLLISCP